MTDYGVFANLVATAGSLASAATAIRLAFMKRSKWQPPEEAVPAVAARLSALMAMIVIAILYVFALRIGTMGLAILSLVLFAIAVACLTVAIRTNITHSFYYPSKSEAHRHLGGDVLTPEAAQIHRDQGISVAQLFEDAQGEKDLVWTKESQASVNIRSTLSFIGLIGFGTCSLAAAAMLVAIAVRNDGLR